MLKSKTIVYTFIICSMIGILFHINIERYLAVSFTCMFSIILYNIRCNVAGIKRGPLTTLQDLSCAFIPIVNALALVFSVIGIFLSSKYLRKMNPEKRRR